MTKAISGPMYVNCTKSFSYFATIDVFGHMQKNLGV